MISYSPQSLSPIHSINLLSPTLLARLTCVFTSTVVQPHASKPVLLLRAFCVRTKNTRGDQGGRKWMPRSVHSTLVNLPPFFNCPVLSMREYVSHVSFRTDISNSRTVVGTLNKPSFSANSLLYVRLSASRSSFLPPSPSTLIWAAVWLNQSQGAFKPGHTQCCCRISRRT